MMAKAINWPLQYRELLLKEPCNALFSAIRPGRLYFDNVYWVPGEEVDIRCNQRVIRRGIVVEELACYPLGQLPEGILKRLKPDIQTMETLLQFLKKTYNLGLTEASEVTVVTYENLPVNPELIEAP